MVGTSHTKAPRPTANAAGRAAPDGHPRVLVAGRPRVLVAEDHEDTRLMLRLYLEGRGFDVVEAADGAEALRLSEGTPPDLILLDGSLPGIDGVGVTSRIRERAAPRRVPIIFLSGHAEPLAQTAAFAAGCDAYLTKPVGLDQLSRVLMRHLDGVALARCGATDGAGLPT